MLMSTFLNLGITPVLYVIIKTLELRGNQLPRGDGKASGELGNEPAVPLGV
jgi:hypothetical protein